MRADTLAESLAAGYGVPSPMLVVLMPPERVRKHVDSINRQIGKDAPERLIEIGLKNGINIPFIFMTYIFIILFVFAYPIYVNSYSRTHIKANLLTETHKFIACMN